MDDRKPPPRAGQQPPFPRAPRVPDTMPSMRSVAVPPHTRHDTTSPTETDREFLLATLMQVETRLMAAINDSTSSAHARMDELELHLRTQNESLQDLHVKTAELERVQLEHGRADPERDLEQQVKIDVLQKTVDQKNTMAGMKGGSLMAGLVAVIIAVIKELWHK